MQSLGSMSSRSLNKKMLLEFEAAQASQPKGNS